MIDTTAKNGAEQSNSLSIPETLQTLTDLRIPQERSALTGKRGR